MMKGDLTVKNYSEHEECRNQEYGVIRTNNLEQISPALKSKRNPLYRKIERSSLFALVFMIPMFLAAFIAMAAYDNSFMCVVIAFVCVYVFLPVFLRILIKKILEMSNVQ